MRLEVEGRATPINGVTEAQIRTILLALRSYGPSSFASLMDEEGNYVQIAGGGGTCSLERHEAASGKQFRAYQDARSKVFADGTRLSFGGGSIELTADEWFTAGDAIDVFLAFLRREPLPQKINWRDISDILSPIPSRDIS
jgi:hypothetical protein